PASTMAKVAAAKTSRRSAMRRPPSLLPHLFFAISILGLAMSPGCDARRAETSDPDVGKSAGTNEDGVSKNVYPYPAEAVPAPFDKYFDAAADGAYKGAYRVVGETTPPSWSWGKIELLEGYEAYRTEGYNLRTAKPRWQDTYQDSTYPL